MVRAGTEPISVKRNTETVNFNERMHVKTETRGGCKPRYDFIVCGSGSSGSVVARRLAENAGGRTLPVEGDVSKSADVVRMFDAAEKSSESDQADLLRD
jgi:hypothetical protein